MKSRSIEWDGERTAGSVATWKILATYLYALAMILPATLLSYFDEVYAVDRPLESNSIYCHRRSLRIFCEWLGQDTPLANISDQLISEFLRDMESRYAPTTVKGLRTNILCVKRHAAEMGLCGIPNRVRKPKVPTLIPEAWSADEVRKLLAATRRLRRHGNYFRLFIPTGWDVGLRKGDLESLDMERVDASGRAALRQAKTSEPIVVTLRLSTVARLRKSNKRFPLERLVSLSQIYFWWKELCLAAGVPHGGPQRLRRSAATAVELLYPGAATAFLGHKSADLARKHYLDPRILCKNPPMPEEL